MAAYLEGRRKVMNCKCPRKCPGMRIEVGIRGLLCNELCSSYCLPSIVKTVRSRRLGWAGLSRKSEDDIYTKMIGVNWRAVVQDCIVFQASVLACEHLHSIPLQAH